MERTKEDIEEELRGLVERKVWISLETAYNEGLNEYYSERIDEKNKELDEVQDKIKELEEELEAMKVRT